jgi:hypothetical protein
MVVDVANVSHIGAELYDHASQPPPRLARIDRVSGQPRI